MHMCVQNQRYNQLCLTDQLNINTVYCFKLFWDACVCVRDVSVAPTVFLEQYGISRQPSEQITGIDLPFFESLPNGQTNRQTAELVVVS